jgi:hypothetical protein
VNEANKNNKNSRGAKNGHVKGYRLTVNEYEKRASAITAKRKKARLSCGRGFGPSEKLAGEFFRRGSGRFKETLLDLIESTQQQSPYHSFLVAPCNAKHRRMCH